MPAKVFGYMRLGDPQGNPHIQEYRQRLTAAGATEIIEDRTAPNGRPAFDALMTRVSAGDVFMVIRLGHISTNFEKLVEVVNTLHGKTLEFVVLDTRIDTRRPQYADVFKAYDALRALFPKITPMDGGDGGE